MPPTIKFFDYLKAIWKRRLVFVSIVFAITAATIIYSLQLTKIYRSEAIIIPLQNSSRSGSSVSSFLSEIPLFGGGIGGGGDNFIIFLESNVLRSQVISALNLLDSLAPRNEKEPFTLEQRKVQAAEKLGSVLKIERDRVFKDRIKVAVEGSDPDWNFKVVRQYLVELQNFITDNALTQAKRYRLFLEEQLAKNKKELLEMGKTLANFYSRNSVSEVRAKLNVPFALKTEEGVRDFQDYGEFIKHFDVLQNQETNSEAVSNVEYVKDVPHQIYLKYLTTQQMVLEQNYTALTASYETAKLEEAKQEPSFQVLNEPILPRYPIWPNKRRLTLSAFVISCFIALFAVFLLEFYRPLRRLTPVLKEESEEVVEKIRWGISK